ncbi:hypothetical protein NT6N_07680 [Oceaniferula spumae]|uniref:Uncharacterized protein n=1 Tax=Oceaniferula spumae TaxID=2979115 RepID=A0AAT9FID4_9BACT
MKKIITSAVALSIMLFGLHAASADEEAKAEVSVKIKVPDPGWKVHIASMHEKDGKLLVICHAAHGSGIHAAAITDVTAKATIKKSLADLPRKIYLVGRSWSWGEGYTAIDEKDVETVTKDSKLVYTAPSDEAPKPDDFVGLTLEKAKTLAEQHKIDFRVIMVDGQPRPATTDLRPDRYNFAVEKGKITKVTKG